MGFLCNPEIGKKPDYLRQREKGRSDRAYTRIHGRKLFFGIYNSPSSLQAYSRLLAEWAGGKIETVKSHEKITMIELCHYYHDWAEKYYQAGSSELPIIKGIIEISG